MPSLLTAGAFLGRPGPGHRSTALPPIPFLSNSCLLLPHVCLPYSCRWLGTQRTALLGVGCTGDCKLSTKPVSWDLWFVAGPQPEGVRRGQTPHTAGQRQRDVRKCHYLRVLVPARIPVPASRTDVQGVLSEKVCRCSAAAQAVTDRRAGH